MAINFMPEHNVGVYRIFIYMKQTDNQSIASTDWLGADIIDSYQYEDIVKDIPLTFSLPDFTSSKSSQQIYQDFIKKYTSWVYNEQTFAIRIVMIDRSNDKLEQTLVFVHQN